MSLGGDGSLNLPYDDVPGGPINVEEDVLIAGGVVVRAAVIAHPITAKPHPVLLFTFHLPDGTTLAPIALVVEKPELRALPEAVRGAAAGAMKAAGR